LASCPIQWNIGARIWNTYGFRRASARRAQATVLIDYKASAHGPACRSKPQRNDVKSAREQNAKNGRGRCLAICSCPDRDGHYDLHSISTAVAVGYEDRTNASASGGVSRGLRMHSLTGMRSHITAQAVSRRVARSQRRRRLPTRRLHQSTGRQVAVGAPPESASLHDV
jgi:hypothetical protein